MRQNFTLKMNHPEMTTLPENKPSSQERVTRRGDIKGSWRKKTMIEESAAPKKEKRTLENLSSSHRTKKRKHGTPAAASPQGVLF